MSDDDIRHRNPHSGIPLAAGDHEAVDHEAGEDEAGDHEAGEDEEDGLFAPAGGWRVRILDLSGGAEDNIVEEVRGFPTLMQANAFARAYVRDSVELCRAGGASSREVLAAWFAFGEDALVIGADGEPLPDEEGWRSAQELGDFADRPAGPDERDWRALDPRRDEES